MTEETELEYTRSLFLFLREEIENIGDTVDILKVIKPVYNFKAEN